MSSLLIFAVALLGIVGIALVVNFVTGTRAHYIDDFSPEPDESILWQDNTADAYLIPVFGRAFLTSYARRRWFTAVLTNRRIIVAQKVLFGRKRLIRFEVVFDGLATAQSPEIFYPRGYLLIQANRSSVDFGTQDDKPAMKIEPVPASRDKNNVASVLLFTDDLENLKIAWR